MRAQANARTRSICRWTRMALVELVATVLLWNSHVAPGAAATNPGNAAPALAAMPAPASSVQVALSAAQSTRSWDSRLARPAPFELPLVYLHRQGQATEARVRTLTLSISGTTGGTSVEVEIVSQHDNRITMQPHRCSARLALPNHVCTSRTPCVLQWALDPAAVWSDLYRLSVRDDTGRLLWQNPDPQRPDFVALDTWEARVDQYTVRVTYAALFPFARGERNLYHRLAPDQVGSFIAQWFAPMVVDTWKTQFGAWGFGPIHAKWDVDRVVEIYLTCLPYALFDGTGTYAVLTDGEGRPYPERRLWLLAGDNTLQGYKTLEDGYRVLFAHEFFHLVQWNVLLSAGCPTQNWRNTFLEAQAKFAASVQYPELELGRDGLAAGSSEYGSAAGHFLQTRLQTSYAVLEAERSSRYDAALYWRFLYERFGSMRPIRAALEEMACRPVKDIPTSLDPILDAALRRLRGPLGSFEESLIAFSQANYALRLEGGRCTTADARACDGRYQDPNRIYPEPALAAALNYDGAPLSYDGSLPASFGADLLQVHLDPAAGRQAIEVAFHSARARFSVQLWRLNADGSRALTAHPEALQGDCSVECRYNLPAPDAAQSVALIVVRLDANEGADPQGSYRLTVG
jgi:hypothetical protein